MTGEGTPTQKGPKNCQRFLTQKVSDFWCTNSKSSVITIQMSYGDIKILIDNQPTDDLSIDYALK